MTTDTLELLCNKLGTTMQFLVPEIIKYLTGKAVYGTVVSLIFFLISAILSAFLIKKCKDEREERDFFAFLSTFPIAICIGTFIALLVNFSNLIMLKVAPYASAIDYIFGKINA